ncbi:MAG: rRNA maturation RNase YbeY [Beijerinckiaceae bacterium]
MARTRLTVDVARHAASWRTLPGVTARVRQAAKAAVAGAGVVLAPAAELAVALSDDSQVRAANRAHRATDKATNVLSFPAVAPAKLASAPFLGDIILAYETVRDESTEAGKPIMDHVTHLTVHGVLHLLGYDHLAPDEAATMETLETAILASLGVADPYAGTDPLEEPAV